MKKHLNLMTKIIIVIVLFAMIVSFTSCEKKQISPTPAQSESALNDDGWDIVENTDTILSKNRSTDSGRTYSFAVNYIDVSDKIAENNLSKDVLTVFSQWALYALTFDMNMHLPLFYEKHLDNQLYSEFNNSGYDKETAIKLIEQNAYILFPFKNVEFNAMITEFSVNSTDAINEVVSYNDMFNEYNMSKEKLGDVFCISSSGAVLFFDEMLYFDFGDELKDIILFEYDNNIYMHFQYLDDDLSIDILEGSIEENRFPFNVQKVTGQVTDINEKYICINENKVYYLKNYDTEMSVTVGERVQISYYSSMGIKLNKKTDYKACEFGIAIEVKKYENFYQD